MNNPIGIIAIWSFGKPIGNNSSLTFTYHCLINPLSANPTKWSNALKEFVGNLPTNCLSVFDHFVGLVLKGLRHTQDFWVIAKCRQIVQKQ